MKTWTIIVLSFLLFAGGTYSVSAQTPEGTAMDENSEAVQSGEVKQMGVYDTFFVAPENSVFYRNYYKEWLNIDKSALVDLFTFGVRTNLLYDMIGVPNVGIEFPFKNNFSVGADFVYGYIRLNNRFAMQTIHGYLEARYWFDWKDRKLSGWNIGVAANFSGRYDMQWQGGWQGDRFFTVGLTGGYSLKISKLFNLDFALGVGAFFTPEMRKYTRPQSGHLVWDETRYNVTRFTITRAAVSLVWVVDVNKKSKR